MARIYALLVLDLPLDVAELDDREQDHDRHQHDRLCRGSTEIETLDGQVAQVRAAGETQGALTAEQQTYLDAQAARRTELEAVVTRLEAKKNR